MTCATASINEHGPVARRRPILVFAPHPLLLAKEREFVYAHFLPNETVLAYLRRTGLLERMGRAPFVLLVEGRRLPRTLWAHCRPKPGTQISLIALTRGGGGGKKNPLAVIGMLALAYFTGGASSGGAAGGAWGASAATAAGFGTAAQWGMGIMVLGGMVVPSILPPPLPRERIRA